MELTVARPLYGGKFVENPLSFLLGQGYFLDCLFREAHQDDLFIIMFYTTFRTLDRQLSINLNSLQ